MATVQSIERAFAILRVLSQGPAGVTEVADRTDLPKSTVSRLLSALEAEGAVAQAEWGGEYIVGQALATLADSAEPRASYGAVIRPFIEQMSEETGGSAGFTLRRGREVYWVDNVDDDAMVQIADQTGQSFPMHAVPTGIALLAALGEAEVENYTSSPLEFSHEEAPRDARQLRDWIARVGDGCLVVSREELNPGINAYAAPFRGPGGTWDGALYLQGPSFRFPHDGDESAVGDLVIDTAAAVSERLQVH